MYNIKPFKQQQIHVSQSVVFHLVYSQVKANIKYKEMTNTLAWPVMFADNLTIVSADKYLGKKKNTNININYIATGDI